MVLISFTQMKKMSILESRQQYMQQYYQQQPEELEQLRRIPKKTYIIPEDDNQTKQENYEIKDTQNQEQINQNQQQQQVALSNNQEDQQNKTYNVEQFFQKQQQEDQNQPVQQQNEISIPQNQKIPKQQIQLSNLNVKKNKPQIQQQEKYHKKHLYNEDSNKIYTEEQLISTVYKPQAQKDVELQNIEKQFNQTLESQKQQENLFDDVYQTLNKCSLLLQSSQSYENLNNSSQNEKLKPQIQNSQQQKVLMYEDLIYKGSTSKQQPITPQDFDQLFSVEGNKFITKFNFQEEKNKFEGKIINKESNQVVYKGGLDIYGQPHKQGKLFQQEENYIIGMFTHGNIGKSQIIEQRINDIVYYQVSKGNWTVKDVDNKWYFDGQITSNYQFKQGIFTDCTHDKKYKVNVENGITKTQILQNNE